MDARGNSQPALVMPHFSLGDLHKEHSQRDLDPEGVSELLFQRLIVLEYLHSRDVAHQDLKPTNILVESQSPLHLRFTDFGCAKDQSKFTTFCGTRPYLAPEAFRGEEYDKAVDTWALRVTGPECGYSLPMGSPSNAGSVAVQMARVWAWCRCLIQRADNTESDALIDLLVMMLQGKPDNRMPASSCLRKGRELGLFEPPSATVECVTPTPTPTKSPTGVACDEEEEDPSIIARRLLDGYSVSTSDNSCGDPTTKIPKSRQLDVLEPQYNQAVPQPSHIARKGKPKTKPTVFGYKRHRSPVVKSPNNLSDESRVKRRPPGARVTEAFSEPRTKVVSLLLIKHYVLTCYKLINTDTEHLGIQMNSQGQCYV